MRQRGHLGDGVEATRIDLAGGRNHEGRCPIQGAQLAVEGTKIDPPGGIGSQHARHAMTDAKHAQRFPD